MVQGLPHAATVNASISLRKKFDRDAKGKYVGLKLAVVERLFVKYANHWATKQNNNHLLRDPAPTVSWLHDIPAINNFLTARWGVGSNL